MKKNIFAAALLASLVSPVMAGDFYLAGDIGRGKIDTDDDSLHGKSDTTFSLGAGFQFSNYFSVELAYRELLSGVRLDFAEDNTSKVSVDSFQVSAVGSLPVGEVASVYGRLGYARLESKVSWPDTSFEDGGSDTASTNKVFFGAGARYAVTDKIGLRAEYDRYAKWDDAVLSVLTLGIDYHF